MPRIFDNIELELLPALRQTLEISEHADFCVGYFNLRGWKSIDGLIEKWAGGAGQQCRLLVGMQRLPLEELRDAYSLLPHEEQMSNQAVIRLKRRLAEEFRLPSVNRPVAQFPVALYSGIWRALANELGITRHCFRNR